jgi:hypothetical protein
LGVPVNRWDNPQACKLEEIEKMEVWMEQGVSREEREQANYGYLFLILRASFRAKTIKVSIVRGITK